MGPRVATPGLAFGALLAGLAGAEGAAWVLLLFAIVSAAAVVVVAVDREAVGAGDRLSVASAVATLVIVLAAAATRTPTIVLCVLVPVAVDILGGVRRRAGAAALSRPVLQDLAAQFADSDVSRAA